MNNLSKSEWTISKIALSAFLGTIISILVVQHEINPKFVIGCLIVLMFVIASNAVYVLSKRKKYIKSNSENH